MADWYTHSGSPSLASSGSSAVVRAEFAAVEAAFAKLPTFAGNGSKWIAVNSGATALTAITGPTLAGAFQTTSAGPITFTLTGITSVTLPTAGTIATIAGTETLTSKTLTAPTLTNPTFTTSGGALTNLSISSGTVANATFTSVTIANPTIAASSYATGTVANMSLTTPTITNGHFTGLTVNALLDLSTTGALTFPTSPPSSAGVNTLDAYRATYTMSPLTLSGGTASINNYPTMFVKIGRQVWTHTLLSIVSNGTAGNFRLNLPSDIFLPQSDSAFVMPPYYYAPGTASHSITAGKLTSGSRQVNVYYIDATAVGASPTEGYMLDATPIGWSTLSFGITYMAAT